MTRKQWHNLHKRCPECKSQRYEQTLIGCPEYINKDGSKSYEDDKNTFICHDCGRKGKVKELVE